MRKAGAFFLLLLLGFTVPLLYAQEEYPDDEPYDPGWDVYVPELYTKGDQTFTINLGLIFPVLFLNNGSRIAHNFSPPVGGMGSLGYNYFLGSKFFVGGEIAGIFNSTLGGNTVFLIPIGVRAGYQFILWRIEIPLSLTVGINWHRFLNQGYFGPFIKAGGSVFYRFNPDWSFGVNANWCWFPEWTNDSKKNVDGNIVEVTLSVRYHF